MTTSKGRRMGGAKLPPLPSTVEDTTPPQAPPADPAGQPASGALAAVPEPSPFGPVGMGRVPGPAAEAAEVPRAEDLCGPRAKVRREQISAHVPEQLRLKRRLALYALDHETDVQDVIAVGLDQWLRAQDA